MNIGKRLLGLRNSLGLTREDAAERIGNITSRTIEKYEGETTFPTVDTLKRMVQAYKSTIAYVVGEIDDPSPDALKALNAYSKEARKIIEMPYEPEFEKWAIEEMTLEELQKAAKETNERLIVYELKDAAKRLQAAILRKTIKDENLPNK